MLERRRIFDPRFLGGGKSPATADSTESFIFKYCVPFILASTSVEQKGPVTEWKLEFVNIYPLAAAFPAGRASMSGDWNAHIIAEFHRNHGKVGGQFEGAPLLLLHHKGARSSKPRINPVMYLKDGDRYLVFASKGGADDNPDWYYNLKAHPDIQIEVGDETIDAHVEEITGPERSRLYARQASLYPAFAQYQRQTKRIIPVMALMPRTRRK